MQEIIVVGNLWAENGYDSAGGRVYDRGGCCCCISSTTEKHPIHIIVKEDNEREKN